MGDVLIGIREDDLSTLSIEILDYADRISELFDDLNSCIETISSNYRSDACTALLNKYNDMKVYFPTIISNIQSYSDDLIAVIVKMKDNDKYLTTLFEKDVQYINSKIKLEQGRRN